MPDTYTPEIHFELLEGTLLSEAEIQAAISLFFETVGKSAYAPLIEQRTGYFFDDSLNIIIGDRGSRFDSHDFDESGLQEITIGDDLLMERGYACGEDDICMRGAVDLFAHEYFHSIDPWVHMMPRLTAFSDEPYQLFEAYALYLNAPDQLSANGIVTTEDINLLTSAPQSMALEQQLNQTSIQSLMTYKRDQLNTDIPDNQYARIENELTILDMLASGETSFGDYAGLYPEDIKHLFSDLNEERATAFQNYTLALLEVDQTLMVDGYYEGFTCELEWSTVSAEPVSSNMLPSVEQQASCVIDK